MTSLRTLLASSLIVAGMGLAAPDGAHAQAARAGVVTTLQGNATVTRVSTAQPAPQVVPLKFRDAVFLQDRVTTGEQSIARILLGGKAVVTVREHSSLTITETANTSTIDISAGKIALAVSRDRIKAGERIDIRTPNAVAGVRGTVLITEVLQATAQAGGTPPAGVTSRFTLLTGVVDVTLLDPTTGRPGPTRFTMNPLQQLGLTGFTPPAGPRNITPAQAQQVASDFQVNLKDAPPAASAQVSERQVELAANVAAGIAGGPSGGEIINTIGVVGSPSGPINILPIDYQRPGVIIPTRPPLLTGRPTECDGSICEGRSFIRR
jgi:hypothetical protein